MRYMSSNEIRKVWLDFFVKKGHLVLESASLIPNNDPTLLWINAGVAPLKKYFDGSQIPLSKRLTNIQKCIRTNDIDNVGKTARHHTFFEMLGNFSIGDYFKEVAIEYAFEILTSKDYFAFPLEKLVFTYYPTDLDTKKKWLSLGVLERNIIPREDNFWEIGEGPCGPDSEIYFDRGEKYDKRGLELVEKDIENERYIEIWNIVFSQFNSKANLKRKDYPELPNKNIDTGAGLERFACILQGVDTNFETDLFYPIILKIKDISKVEYNGQMAFKVIADHIKTLVFAIADGAVLSNVGRGYVLRRILRRAVRYGIKLGLNKPFLNELVDIVVEMMGEFYPQIRQNSKVCKKIIKIEEEKFFETIIDGEKHLDELLKREKKEISGKSAFMLYDTYGFPIELTLEYAGENNVKVDIAGFEEELKKQKNRSKKARNANDSMKVQNADYLKFKEESKFIGYDFYEVKTKVIAVFEEGIILEETPFYATSGGQINDLGFINEAKVLDVKKLPKGQHLHITYGKFKIGDIVNAKIDLERREKIKKNHSATHLLHKALKEVFGTHVIQQGSLVADKYFRFDFNHFEKINDDDILKIEKMINDMINLKSEVSIKQMNINDAKKLGAMALFGEKYGNIVRVVQMGSSIELCGGTHVENIGDINKVAIINFESIGSGIFRITATTNDNINEMIFNQVANFITEIDLLNKKGKKTDLNFQEITLKNNFNSYQDILDIKEKLKELRLKIYEIDKREEANKKKDILSNFKNFMPKDAGDKITIKLENYDNSILKELIDNIFDKQNAKYVILVNITPIKATYIVKSDGDINAVEIVRLLAKLTQGSGGGNEKLSQGGTKRLDLIDDALVQIKKMF